MPPEPGGEEPAFVVIHGAGGPRQCHKSQMLYSRFHGVIV